MDYIREAENYLRYYRQLQISLDHASREIARLMHGPSGIRTAVIDMTGIRAQKPHDTLKQCYQLQQWQAMREQTRFEIERLDEILNSISAEPGCERYKEILLLWYVEKMDKDDIARELGYSPNSKESIYGIKNKAIRKFAVALFGIRALQAI